MAKSAPLTAVTSNPTAGLFDAPTHVLPPASSLATVFFDRLVPSKSTVQTSNTQTAPSAPKRIEALDSSDDDSDSGDEKSHAKGKKQLVQQDQAKTNGWVFKDDNSAAEKISMDFLAGTLGELSLRPEQQAETPVRAPQQHVTLSAKKMSTKK